MHIIFSEKSEVAANLKARLEAKLTLFVEERLAKGVKGKAQEGQDF